MSDFEDRVLTKLDNLTKVTSYTKAKVDIMEGQNTEQFTRIRLTEKQVNINMTEIGNLKQRRNGRGWLGKILIRLFLGAV